MHPLAIFGAFVFGLAMGWACFSHHARKGDYYKVRNQSRKAVNAWLSTVDDSLKLNFGAQEAYTAKQNKAEHVHAMLRLRGILDETRI